MLTPRFELWQDDKYLVVTIYAPFTNIDRTEVFMDGTDFRFSSPPYFLRLHLPGEVEENDAASGAWDAETTSFVVKCPKVVEGEHFPGLDMLTQLLTPKGDTSLKNAVEELNGEEFEGEEEKKRRILNGTLNRMFLLRRRIELGGQIVRLMVMDLDLPKLLPTAVCWQNLVSCWI